MCKNCKIYDFQNDSTYDIAFCSGIGKRKEQQDSAGYYADDKQLFAVVCDGMGGLGGGELASNESVHYFLEYYQQHIDDLIDHEWMANVLLTADKKIFELTDDNGNKLGCGSTAILVWIKDNNLYFSSVGDSRLYIYRNNQILQLTDDLNYYFWLDEKVKSGEISKEKYEIEKESGEALISFLGHGNINMIDRNMQALELFPEDKILICTDGLYRTIDQEWLGELLAACENMDEMASFIDIIIREHGSSIQDNYTGIMIQYKG